jgi:hypothetical protein
MIRKRVRALSFVAVGLFGAILACQGNTASMVIGGVPEYICPSSTPRPTSTMPPPSPPTYPTVFSANVDYTYVDPARSTVTVQYQVQNVGMVQISITGTTYEGRSWYGGTIPVAYTGNYAGTGGVFPVSIPTDVASASIRVSSLGGTTVFPIMRYSFIFNSTSAPPPCCLPAPIYPTLQPTYTPYPTPTDYKILAPSPFYAEDAIYNTQSSVRLRLRLKYPMRWGMAYGILTASSWTIQITNVGSAEYAFLGAGYMYVSEVEQFGKLESGVWSPTQDAATFLGVIPDSYGAKAIQPGESMTLTVAAWIPATARITKVAMVLNPYRDGIPGYATLTPGDIKIVEWVNELNPHCRGDIRAPRG